MTVLRIGVAEDQHDQRWALTSLLVALGHHVVCEAADGKALVDGLEQAIVDLVITDLEMPVLNGLAPRTKHAMQHLPRCPPH